ncbi:MAG: response regulator transcription factor [Campylobacteraceae bacterium]|nr:response regulator transcription factor [Campylobacteraceae bacterium]
MKILLLEDDMILSEIIEEFLTELDYEVSLAYTGVEAEDLAYSTNFDLLLLDVNVPNGNGFEFLGALRDVGNKTPAIFITSLDDSQDMQIGFDKGCDDYIKKPFELKELEIRINNIKRLYKIEDSAILKINEHLSFDTNSYLLIKEDEQIQLPKKEALILMYFAKNKNKTISTEELGINVWDYESSPSDATIRTYIKNLRKVIGAEVLTNVKGVGYRFN